MKKGLRLKGKAPDTKRLLVLAVVIWLLFLAAASLLPKGEKELEGTMEVTDPRRLESAIPKRGVSLVFFKAYGCPSCARVEPALTKFVNERDNVTLIVANLSEMSRADYTATLNLMGQYNVRGTPTLLLYANGSLLARKVGDFGLGDQYEGVKKFVEGNLANAPREPAQREGGGGALELFAFLSGSLVLGLFAAVSPCSLPVLLAYASAERVRASGKDVVRKSAALWAVAAAGGLLLAGAYSLSALLPLNLYALLSSFIASLLVAWGILTLWTSNPTLVAIPQLSKAAPLLGIQCSLPFLLTLVAIAGSSPLLAALGGLLFALGFSLPFSLLSSATSLADSVVRFMNSRAAVVLQGLALLLAGGYVLYYLYSDFSL